MIGDFVRYIQSGRDLLRLDLIYPLTGIPGFKTMWVTKKQIIFFCSVEGFVKSNFRRDVVLGVKIAFKKVWSNLEVGRLINGTKSSAELTSHLPGSF